MSTLWEVWTTTATAKWPVRGQRSAAEESDGIGDVQYKIYVRQKWARANELTGTIKLSEFLMGIILLGPDIHTALKV